MTAPSVTELWLGPEVVATPSDIESLASIAVDPLMGDISKELPANYGAIVLGAMDRFGKDVYASPGPSFVDMEAAFAALDADPDLTEDPDTEVVHEALLLYRDWASQTLFGMERGELGPIEDMKGH